MWLVSPRAALAGLLCLVILQSSESLAQQNTISNQLVVRNVARNIDLQSQLTKITYKFTVENVQKSAVNEFHFYVHPSEKDQFSYISAQSREPGRAELVVKEDNNNAESRYFVIKLKDQLSPGRSMTIEVETILTHQLKPYPKEITQKEKQLVKYIGNLYVYSPYVVTKQSTTIVLPSNNVESYTKIQPVSQSVSTITYGPYEKVAAFGHKEMVIHFENNNKFLTITRLERTIEISHWGNIAVEENIELLHTGALLKGSFSRYEYARESRAGQASVHSFDTVLPAAAMDIYYRDEIGNISTSHTRIKKDSVEVNLRPRFPLFGGWKTKYILGYNVPSYEYLFHSGNDYTLQMRLLDHVFDDMVVDELFVKVILPEGSKNIDVILPYFAKRLPDTLHYTYLDTTGRPVISITKTNLVENHIQSFRVNYTFPRLLMLQEPLLVAAALYLLFLLVIVYVRLDFSINKDEASESKLRIQGQCEKILAAQDRRVTSYNDLEDQLNYLKSNKDTEAFLTAVKSINQEYKNTTNMISELAQKLKAESGDVYERVMELQRVDKMLKELYNQQQSLYVDKSVSEKIARQQMTIIAKKREEYIERINSVVKSLH